MNPELKTKPVSVNRIQRFIAASSAVLALVALSSCADKTENVPLAKLASQTCDFVGKHVAVSGPLLYVTSLDDGDREHFHAEYMMQAQTGKAILIVDQAQNVAPLYPPGVNHGRVSGTVERGDEPGEPKGCFIAATELDLG